MLLIRRMLMMENDEEMKEWELIKERILEEQTAWISKTLDDQYKELLLIYENLWSSNKTGIGIAISFNGNNTASSTTSFSTGAFVNSEQFPSQGFFEVKFLPNGCDKVIGAGINSGANRGSAVNNLGYMTKDQIKNLDYINKVNFSSEAYGTNKMNVGAKIYIYGR